MNGSFVGLADYPANSPVAGVFNASELASLNKALVTGNDVVTVGGPNAGVSALRPQSLESTLKVLTFTQKQLKLWPKLAKDKANSTLEEYNRLDDLGENGDGFIGEVATPNVVDETFTRDAVKIRFMGIKKEVSLAATLVNSSVGPVENQLVKDAMTTILKQTEYACIHGNNDISPLAYNGFKRQIEAFQAADTNRYGDLVLDYEGNPPDQEMVETAQKTVARHFGYMDYLLMSINGKSDLSKSLFPGQRINMPPDAAGRVGTPFNTYVGSAETDIESSVLIDPKAPRSTGQTGAPGVLTAYTAAVGTDSASKLEAGRTYYYWVSVGLGGLESAALAASVTTTTLGQKITLTVADAQFTGTATASSYLNIYRSTDINDITKATLIAQVKRAASGADTVYVDLNQSRDNCSFALGFTWDPEQVVTFKQLAPIMKLPLAVTGTSQPFMVLLFGSPLLYAPSKCILIKNIGKLAA